VRIAALDLGSNSFHLLVADVRPDGSLEPIVRDKEMLRIGSRVALTGEVGDVAGRAALDVVRRFAALAESLDAEEIVACGTAALRHASDAAELITRIEVATGIQVRVITGEEEARLIFGAVRASVVIDAGPERPSEPGTRPALAMDLGGGSLELMVGDQSGLEWCTSLELGVAKLTAELVRSDPPSAGDRRRVVRRVREALEPCMPEIEAASPVRGIASSGTLTTLIRLAAADDGQVPASVNQLGVGIDRLRQLEEDLLKQTSAQRADLPGVDARRADLLPAGILTCVTVMDMAGIDQLIGCEWALREGMVLDAIATSTAGTRADDPSALRRRSVLDLCRRCRWPDVHSRKVARLAVELFDGTVERHGLGAEDRELLEFGALLHDVGEHVSADNHERHSAYLIQHGRLRGFSPEEVDVLACLGRFHRRGNPKASFEAWAGLAPARRERTLPLIALLQAADGLDRGHGGPVRDVRVTSGPGPLIEVNVDADGDIDLERYGLRRKGELLERLFSCRLELVERGTLADQLAV
jgi:exopolyphosphatase/guanosine-5'-triphosphate,3'-diphosphate pyrophosphatase